MRTSFSPWALALAMLPAGPAWAQGVATEHQLAPVVITGARRPLDPNLPNTTASLTREELRDQNLFNPEDALRYLPSTGVRKRYIGDRNALLSGRSFTSIQAARGLVFMDGYLLSNFLGRFDAPRWNMVAPEEIERVDVLYGPFSALYPGNSIGTTVAMTTRMPKSFEASVRATMAVQEYDAYGHADRYGAWQTSAFVGDRLQSGLRYTVSLNHQDSTSQPMQYFTVSRNAQGVFPASQRSGAPVEVTGVHYDLDPQGRERAVFGANSGAIDRTVQDLAKLRLAYDLTPDVVLDGFVAGWANDTRNTNRSFLRDAAGQPVWSGKVTNGGNVFDISDAVFAPSTRDERHWHTGLTLKTRRALGWNGSVVVSAYRIQDDALRQAAAPDPVAEQGGGGTLTLRDGTAWNTFEAQATYTPQAGDWGGGKHALVVGLHHNAYRLNTTVHDLLDWRGGGAGGVAQTLGGKTRLTALYAQDAWRFAEQWKATFGLRLERWEAFDGYQHFTGLAPEHYAARSATGRAPKLSLSWAPAEDWLLRASVGRGVRFPTVVELFQGTRTGNDVQRNDPDLRPEKSNAMEFSAERTWGAHQLRASVFQENIRDTIFSQKNTAVVPNVTNVQNVARVRARGLELVWSADHWPVRGMRLEANAAFVDARTLESNHLQAVGKRWVRVPRTRASVIAAYAFRRRWNASLAVRHSGRQYNELDNSDSNPDTFGGVSSYTVADARVTFKPTTQIEFAMGIDNLGDERIFVYHPLPARTLFAELRWRY